MLAARTFDDGATAAVEKADAERNMRIVAWELRLRNARENRIPATYVAAVGRDVS